MPRRLHCVFIPLVVCIVVGCATLSVFALAGLWHASFWTGPGLPSASRVESLTDGMWVATVRVFNTNTGSVLERVLLFTDDKAAALDAAAAAEPCYSEPLHGDPRIAFWFLWAAATLASSSLLSTAAYYALRKLMSAHAKKGDHSLISEDEST